MAPAIGHHATLWRVVKHSVPNLGETPILTKDLVSLNELQWALLNAVSLSWDLTGIDESEHFDVFRLQKRSMAKLANALILPDRPVKLRNSL